MKIFKNEVGRPSNETLAKRRKIKILIVVLAVLVVGAVSYFTYSFVKYGDIAGAYKNAKSGSSALSIKCPGSGLIIGTKKCESGNSAYILSKKSKKYSIGKNVVYTASALKELTFNATTNLTCSNGSKSCYILRVITYDKNNTILETKSSFMTNNAGTATIPITERTRYARVLILKGVTTVVQKSVKISKLPVISSTVTTNVSKNSSGVYQIPENGVQTVRFSLSNYNNGRKMYYRVFKYRTNNLKTENVTDDSGCTVFNSNINRNVDINVDSDRTVLMRVYSNKNICKKDKNAKYTNSGSDKIFILRAEAVKFKTKHTTTNTSGYTVIQPTYEDDISTKIGHQSRGACLEFSFRYAAYVMKGSLSSGSGNSSASYGATRKTYGYGKESDLFNDIVKGINIGTPVIIHTSNGRSTTHYVVVIGYRYNLNGTVGFNDLWIIDPWNNDNYDATGKGVVFFGPSYSDGTIENESTAQDNDYYKAGVRTTMTGGLHSDHVYYVWSSKSAAK